MIEQIKKPEIEQTNSSDIFDKFSMSITLTYRDWITIQTALDYFAKDQLSTTLDVQNTDDYDSNSFFQRLVSETLECADSCSRLKTLISSKFKSKGE